MKLTVLQENLAKNVSLASRFASTRAQLPILGNILLSATKSKLYISSTNLEISVSIEIGAKIEKEGEIAVPAKVLSELVVNLPKEAVSLEVEKEQLKVSTSLFTSIILGMNTSDFPKIPSIVHKDRTVNLPRNEFSKALSKVIFSSSSDETRPILTGVLFIFEKGNLTLVATDSFRLSSTRFQIPHSVFQRRFVLPKLILSEVGRVEDGEEFALEVSEKEKHVVFGIGDTVLSSRLLEGDFPDFEKIIPKVSRVSAIADKEDFLRAVKLSAPFARENSNILKLVIRGQQLVISAESSTAGSQETKIDAKITAEGPERVVSGVEPGVEWEIAFSYKFLEDFLGSVDGEEVKMEFSDTDKPGVFTDPTDPNYLHLIMPVKIQS